MLRQRQRPGLRLVFATILIAVTTSVPAFAESSTSNDGPDFNPNWVMQKAPEQPKDRKDDAKKAGDTAAAAIPPTLAKAAQHMKNAQDHNDKASQLQQSNPGQAESERKKAAMEQQMANQLQQQAKANQKNSEDNKKASDAAKSEEKVTGKKLGGADKISSKVDENKVIMVDDQRQSDSQLGGKVPAPKEEETDPLKKELATFADYVPPERPATEATPAPAAPAASEPAGEQTSFLKPEWNSLLAGQGSAGAGTGAESSQPNSGDPTAQAAANGAPAPATAAAPGGGNFGTATPAVLAGSGEIGRGLDKDFFKEKDKNKKKKKKVASRGLASRWKGTKIRRVEAELEADAPPPLLNVEPASASLPK